MSGFYIVRPIKEGRLSENNKSNGRKEVIGKYCTFQSTYKRLSTGNHRHSDQFEGSEMSKTTTKINIRKGTNNATTKTFFN